VIQPWYARFLGQVRIERDDEIITRFRSQKTTLLFAFLACNTHRDHGREELIARFWPEEVLEAGRNNLRVALSSLRKVLEPPPTPAHSVLIATRTHVRLRSDAVRTDVGAFDTALKAGRLGEALALYATGPFLPGFYDDWAIQERERIEALAEAARQRQAQETGASVSSASGPLITPTDNTVRAISPSLLHNLPITTDRFFGREEEITRLEMLLLNPVPETRLITITGAGGAGKTRLAIETARRFLNGKVSGPTRALLTGGIWYASLTEVRETNELAATIALRLRQAMGLSGDNPCDPLAEVRAALEERRTILLLDNLEQVAHGAVSALTLLLERLPGCTLLVTSRVRMGLRGEQVLALAPLPVPEGETDRDTLARNASARLFADRARVVEADFALTAGNAVEVARLLRLLEGVPLAIELAAAWANVLTPRQMREQIERRREEDPANGGRKESFPARRPGGREERHHSLHAAFQWSYALLPTEARRLLARLSVFRGGFTGDAVTSVCEIAETAAMLSLLHGHSLITGRATADGAAVRFSLLESLREFAAALLERDEQTGLAARHAACFLRLAEEMRLLYGTPDTARALDRMEQEQDNVRAALDWAIQEEKGEMALRLAAALQWPWRLRGPLPEGRRYLSAILSLPDTQEETIYRADALNALGSIALTQRDMEEARLRYQESLVLCRRLGYTTGQIAALSNLATTFMDSGDCEAARPLFDEALTLVRQTGHKGREAIILYNLGNLAHWQRELEEAEWYHAAALAIRRELGDMRGVALSVVGLGILAMERRDFVHARDRLREGLRLQFELGDCSQIDAALENLARAEEGLERLERGVVLRAAAEALRSRLNIASSPLRQEALDSEAALLWDVLGEPCFTRAQARGAALDLDAAVAFALEEKVSSIVQNS
jgi:predicted ATPase